MPQYSTGAILVWPNGSSMLTRNLNGTVRVPNGFFLSLSGDMYVDNGGYNAKLDKWAMNGISGETVMLVPSSCHSVFVDIADHVYCSLPSLHQVLRKSLAGAAQTVSVAAGTGCSGSAANKLNSPHGIFVDINLDLYVADSGNNRIQRFRFGQLNATTVVGRFGLFNWTLRYPSSVVLDGNGNLFIVDSYNHRIVTAGSNGTRCIIGCSNPNGFASDQLSYPSSLSFDSFGNIFVTDVLNQRIQKFLLATNSCGEYGNELLSDYKGNFSATMA